MKKFLLFPLDLLLLTSDAWKLTIAMFLYRGIRGEVEQPCPYCMGKDNSEAPHSMASFVHYQNIWMMKLVFPCIKSRCNRRKKRIPICQSEGGYLVVPFRVPLVAIGTLCIWLGLAAGILELAYPGIVRDLTSGSTLALLTNQ